MNSIYKNYADVYELMYKSFINYHQEYELYNKLMNLSTGKAILELACGTGNLAPFFLNEGYRYRGLDLNQSMLDIGQLKTPEAIFIKGDMKNFHITQKVDGVLVMARSVSYMDSNEDFINMLTSIHNALNENGVVVFDIIDATRFIPPLKDGLKVTHQVKEDNAVYSRDSHWSVAPNRSWNFRWVSDYYLKNGNDERKLLCTDDSTVRAFTANDIEIFLKLASFEIEECFERESYAFPTLVFKGRKK